MKNIFTIILLVGILASAKAQDNHFSMFYNSPLSLNPAMTGLMVEDIRAVTQYRSQWQSVTVPYETMLASVDANILESYLQNDFVGVGLMMYNDKAGDAEFRNTQVALSASYSKDLSGEGIHYLSGGFQVGFGQQAVNFGKLLFDSQFDGQNLNPNISSGENLSRDNFVYLDMGAGVAWFFTPTKKTSFYAGFAVAHMNEPNMSFVQGAENPLYMRWTAHAGVEFPITDGLSLIPRAVVLFQGPHQEVNLGGLLKFRVNSQISDDYGQTAFYLGTMHRVGDSQIIIAKFDINRFSLAAAYDFNISSLDIASRSNGGFEIGLTYKTWLFGQPSGSGPVGCPTF
ncbi:MAG: type IX secretion system PorP/SprF family membrane protein [Cognaticolwellia sp.]|jgi:type IX secretion system PorP/SprF family membrane protein